MIRRKEVGEEDEMRGESEGYSRRGYNDHAPEYDSEEEEEKRRKMSQYRLRNRCSCRTICLFIERLTS